MKTKKIIVPIPKKGTECEIDLLAINEDDELYIIARNSKNEIIGFITKDINDTDYFIILDSFGEIISGENQEYKTIRDLILDNLSYNYEIIE